MMSLAASSVNQPGFVLDAVTGQLHERLLQRRPDRGQLVDGDPGRQGGVADHGRLHPDHLERSVAAGV